MTSQVLPEEFSSAHQNGKERITIRLTLPAETLANIRAVSYAIGSLSLEQLIHESLRLYQFDGPQERIANHADAWDWDDEEERERLEEAKVIADTCEDDWPAFRAKVAVLPRFGGG